MIRRLKYTLAVAVLALAGPATAATVTIDFENFERGDRVAAGTDIGGGLTLDRSIGFSDQGFLENAPATEGIVAFAPSPVNGQGDDVSGSFARATDFLQIGVGDVGFDTDIATLTGFDKDGNIIDSASFSGQSAEFLTITGAGIVSFFLDIDDVASGQVDQNGSGGFDNISFNVPAVPLPAGLPLLGAGLLGLGLLARRRNSA